MINLKHFEPNMLKNWQNSYKNISIYNIGYVTIKKIDDYESIYSVNSLYLNVNHANGYIEEKNEDKILDLWLYSWKYMNHNNENISKSDYTYQANVGKCDYEKIFMKIKFNSDDDLSLNKSLKFHAVTITIRSVFEEDGKLYAQVVLDDALYELII